jgi:NhaA family Na+:H+ antiporter
MKHKKFKSQLNPTNVLTFLLKEERRSGVVLILVAIAALLLANSVWSETYFEFINQQFTLGSITLDLKHWVSEGLMAIFFLMVVLEVKRELIDGELSTWRKASFPLVAAVGGMVVPAFIYTLVNQNSPENIGWAIPIATDIAIAIGVLALLGKRIPKSLRIFLLALAIIDDIGSILVIGVFYSQPANTVALMIATILSLSLFAFRKQRRWILSFAIIGFCIWYCLLLAGISGTMAGVIVAAMAPLSKRFVKNTPLQDSEKIEDVLLPITAYIIVPLFVFTSAGLVFSELSFSQGNGLSVFAGVVTGLLVGKPLGIFGASLIATKLQLAYKPAELSWSHVLGVGFIAGIGFTISLLIADLSFNEYPALQNTAIFGVFVASIVSAIIGLLILATTSVKKRLA